MAKAILLAALISLSLVSTACITTGPDGKAYDCTGVPSVGTSIPSIVIVCEPILTARRP
jgi:hypothetical protein